MIANRNVSIIRDVDGNSIVMINDIIFKGKRKIDWIEVESYLRRYVGEFYTIADDKELVYIGTDLPDEYAHSEYTNSLKGTNAKAKANAVQGLPEMIEIAMGCNKEDNRKKKHNRRARNGWYRYDTRFGIPVYDAEGEIERYNVFHARLLIRHDVSGKKFLYDILEIKKETSKPCQE